MSAPIKNPPATLQLGKIGGWIQTEQYSGSIYPNMELTLVVPDPHANVHMSWERNVILTFIPLKEGKEALWAIYACAYSFG